MSKNQIELITALILLSLYLIALIILRFGFKIKRNLKLEGKIRKTLPKAYSYIYIFLLIVGFVEYVFLKGKINLLLIVLGDQLILSSRLLKETKNSKEKYYDYFSIGFSSIAIVLLIINMIFF
ncbi:hypothetical protein [Clostridium perfringens]|uniref:hypothetical protein n=1 Tax=Clostridium perfringens TaxID=1502 RepID=UPI0013E3A1C3|nr:hypothetical protein [Clostridium perfringens]NGT55495.1 hypothetical protein [Clostridium perfringens]